MHVVSVVNMLYGRLATEHLGAQTKPTLGLSFLHFAGALKSIVFMMIRQTNRCLKPVFNML